jgi:hypothetical protein
LLTEEGLFINLDVGHVILEESADNRLGDVTKADVPEVGIIGGFLGDFV